MPNHKKFFILLFAMIILAGLLFYSRVNKARQITVNQTQTPLIAQNAIFIPPTDSEQIWGNPGAENTLVEFVDLGCGKCLAMHATIKNFVSKHPQSLRLVWKDNVKKRILSDYTLAHEAAFCAGNPKGIPSGQNKFWEFIDTAMGNKNSLSEPGLKKIAQNLNLDLEKWWLCVNSSETKQAIISSGQTASQLGIKSLPAIFINNKLINTDADINLEEMLNNFIAK